MSRPKRGEGWGEWEAQLSSVQVRASLKQKYTLTANMCTAAMVLEGKFRSTKSVQQIIMHRPCCKYCFSKKVFFPYMDIPTRRNSICLVCKMHASLFINCDMLQNSLYQCLLTIICLYPVGELLRNEKSPSCPLLLPAPLFFLESLC